ncbi:PREDICTED: cell number regulator 10-like [Nelumbo nucifera]|uniref:Cell number regulator 10-like n=1 Tax=Nelumbo nucifera TaxID=4432 RepID=A0A1U8Q2K4_NELNU|nr:PREDICTED: cell number regulator 10-like [Nelumbo nucifera]
MASLQRENPQPETSLPETNQPQPFPPPTTTPPPPPSTDPIKQPQSQPPPPPPQPDQYPPPPQSTMYPPLPAPYPPPPHCPVYPPPPGPYPPMQNPMCTSPSYPENYAPQPPPGSQQTGIPMGYPVVCTQQRWKSGLFDCLDDPANTIITFFLPCLTFGQIAEIVDDGQTPCGLMALLYAAIQFAIGFPCVCSCIYRTKLRNKFGLLESPGPDWLVHFCCEYCALCQEYRELRHRGFDPSIGNTVIGEGTSDYGSD